MARSSAAAADMIEHAHPKSVLPPPPYLTPEQAATWCALVDPFPAARFGADHVPVLVELVRAMAVSRVIAEQLDALRGRSLTSSSKAGAATRSLYLQLAAAARDQSRVIASLSTKLRLTHQSNTRIRTTDNERRREPPGARPWDVERH
jgi:hypothetical protein